MAEEIKFEKAMERLEKIVEDLENGNIALEDALKKYEEGVKLSRVCHERLTQAEKKIEVLTKSLDGKFSKEPFDVEEADEVETKSAKPRAKGKAASRETESDDEDMLI